MGEKIIIMSKSYVVDGNSLLFRSYYSTAFSGKIMSTKDGIPTNAIFAFHNLIKKIKSEMSEEDHLFVAFDTDKPTFRKKEFADYKAQRAKIPDELISQIPISRELLDSMSIYYKEMEGYEADDLCGSFAKYASSIGDQVILFSSDKDFLQLLDFSDNIEIRMPKKGLSEIEVFTKNNLKDSLGLFPNQIPDFKGIAGDNSDNYKGIKGIGPKTAIKLLNEYNDLDGVLEYCKNNIANSTCKNIYDNKDDAIFYKQLATIYTDLDMKNSYQESLYKKYDKDKLLTFYNKYELSSFIKSVDKMVSSSNSEEHEEFSLSSIKNVIKIDQFSQIKDEIKFFMYKSDSENENTANLLGFVFRTDKDVFYLDYSNASNDIFFLSFLQDSKKKLITFDIKTLFVLLSRYDLPKFEGEFFDLYTAMYILNSDSTSDKFLSLQSFGYQIDIKSNVSEQIAFFSLDLFNILNLKLKEENSISLLKEVEQPLSKILSDMEIEGFPVNKIELEKIGNDYQKIINELESKIYDLAGKKFNINSPKQLEVILFSELGIKKRKKDKGTGIEVLNSHKYDHPIVPLIIDYRMYSKIVNTYTTALCNHISKDGKIHALFNQCQTTTGRLSMSEPNLQNISIRSEQGKNIRKAFFYDDDNFILSFDYSQIELRMLASIANILPLIELFNGHEDIHRATASMVFNVPISDVSEELRRRAKTVNFGIIYGISAYGLANQLNISNTEASDLISLFKKSFVGLDEFSNGCISKAKKDGYVSTILNRRRYLKDINSSNFALRSFSERAAINSVIQGSAADLIKLAMINCSNALKNYKTKMILQIHDELLFKVPKNEIDIVMPIIKREMENAMKLKVPLIVSGSCSKTWYDAH